MDPRVIRWRDAGRYNRFGAVGVIDRDFSFGAPPLDSSRGFLDSYGVSLRLSGKAKWTGEFREDRWLNHAKRWLEPRVTRSRVRVRGFHMPPLPTGTVTFLFTDIEGSTRLLQQLGERYADVLETHRRLLRGVIQQTRGYEFESQGDAVLAAFGSARDALAAAVAAQRALHSYPWPEGAPVRVRMGLHTGHPTVKGSGYVGLVLHATARISQAGHGGQILTSQVTRDLVADDLPPGVTLRSLGVHRLKDLSQPQTIFQVVDPDLPNSFPPLKLLDAVLNNLPIQLSSFIGREREIVQVKQLFATTRLLTLTGSGGCGKTRLALQAAAEVLEDFEDGVWLVEFASVSDPNLVAQKVAFTLNLREQQGRPLLATIADYLQLKHLLLVLDNCDHLITTCAQLVDTLLRGCPQLRIFATSREALRMAGEVSLRVPSLSLPDPSRSPSWESLTQYEAIRLFTERATAALPTFTLTSQNAGAVVQVCHRLDGIPLAIELAAARIRALSLEQIAKRLDDRFQLLTGGIRTSLPRQQTLKATMDWSYDELSTQELILFRRLSVFASGFALEAVEAVCAGDRVNPDEVLDVFSRLVEKSLVEVENKAESSRYRLLETVRQYSRDRLRESGEAEQFHTQHRDWYLGLAERIEPELQGPDESMWLDRLDLEHDNLRAALEWSTRHEESDEALRLAGALGWFWFIRGYWSEGREWLERALARSRGDATAARAKALYRAGFLAWRLGDYGQAVALSEESLTLCKKGGDDWGSAFSLQTLGAVARYQGEYARAEVLHEESLRIFRGLREKWGIAFALSFLGLVAYRQGSYERATGLYDESLSLFRGLRQQWGTAIALHNLGIAQCCQGNYARAIALHEESLTYFRAIGDKLNTGQALYALGTAAWQQGDCARATALHEEGLALSRELGDKPGIAYSLHSLGMVAEIDGRLVEAATLQQESLALFRALGDKPGIALSLYGLGIAKRSSADYGQAVAILRESLVLRAQMGDNLGIAECLEGLGEVACVQNRAEQASRLLGAAEALRQTIGAPLPPVHRPEYMRHLDLAKAGLGMPTFTRAWAEGRAVALADAVQLALTD